MVNEIKYRMFDVGNDRFVVIDMGDRSFDFFSINKGRTNEILALLDRGIAGSEFLEYEASMRLLSREAGSIEIMIEDFKKLIVA